MITIKNYTNNEINFIRENYNTMTVQDIAEQLCKTVDSINYVIRRLGLKKQKHALWSQEEINYLFNHYAIMSVKDISQKLNRSVNSINTKCNQLNLYKCKPWTNDEIDYIKTNFQRMTHEQLGKKLHRTASAIRAKCFELDLYKKELPWTAEEIAYLQENYLEMSISEISKILNRTSNAIELKASRLGLKKYPYTCNYHYFDNIDTEEKAYWLGFLTADGWISKSSQTNAGVIGIELQYSDVDHLRKFNKSLSGNYKITDRWKKCPISTNPNKKNHMCMLRIFSKIMYQSLNNLGFSCDKSYNSKIPNLPTDLIKHYIRGFFDGDGCFTFTNKSFRISLLTSSEQFYEDLIAILNEQNIIFGDYSTISNFGTKIFRPEINRIQDKIKFLNWIYADATIYLDRKYKKYLKVKEKYSTHHESLAS